MICCFLLWKLCSQAIFEGPCWLGEWTIAVTSPLRSKGGSALDESATVEHFPDTVDPDVGTEGEEIGPPVSLGVTN